MPAARDVLTHDALAMLELIATTGSFAAAARERNMVPSALTYRVRQIEDALDQPSFDRVAHRQHDQRNDNQQNPEADAVHARPS